MLYKKIQFIVETNKNHKFVFDKMQGQSHAILIIFNLIFSIYCYYIFFQKKQNQNVYTNRRNLFARGLPFERS